MISHLLVSVLTLVVLPAVAFAQRGGATGHLGSPEQQRTRPSDVERFRREVQTQGDYAIADCLKRATQAQFLPPELSKPVTDKP